MFSLSSSYARPQWWRQWSGAMTRDGCLKGQGGA